MASTKAFAIKSPRKLIEVALPLDKINAAAAREKSIRHGHPSTLHLWWARRPLAAARAVIFAQLVNDPGFERHLNRGVNKVEAAKERERLFKIMEELVIWENTNNEEVLESASEITQKLQLYLIGTDYPPFMTLSRVVVPFLLKLSD
jgi:putative DNA methylase